VFGFSGLFLLSVGVVGGRATAFGGDWSKQVRLVGVRTETSLL
jgi:hypothetical protein